MYPAKDPMNTKSRIKTVTSEPLFAGDSSPKRAKVRVATLMSSSCMPVPTNTLNSIGLELGKG